MRHLGALLLLLCITELASAQIWTPVWRVTVPPYLELSVLDEFAMVRAGLDTDKDGWGEFICTWTDEDTNAICMYEADGNNSYKLVWSWVYPIAANSFAGIAVGDVNNNGVVDIVTSLPTIPDVTDPNPPRIWVFEWNGVTGANAYGIYNPTTQTFDPSASWNLNLAPNYDFRPYSLVIDDIDKDNANELIVGARQAGSVIKREVIVADLSGDFAGFWSPIVEWSYSGVHGGSNYSTSVGDLDNDGNKEIHMFIWNFFTLRVFECTGDKQFTMAAALDTVTKPRGVDVGALDGVVVADVNNDGVKEMYVAGTEPENKVYVITGISNVSNLTPADVKILYTIPRTSGGKFRSMQLADPDKDGKPNLMIAGETNGQIFTLEYQGSGNPADSASWRHQVIYDIFVESSQAVTPRLFYGYPAKDMDKDGRDEYVFVNYAPDYGVWAEETPLKVIEIDVVADVREEGAPIPSSMRLMQNYPNPFNPETQIRFELPAAADVRLTVYDMLGREVDVLVSGRREAGTYRATFNGAGKPSGVYFCRLQAGETVQTMRMLLVK